MHTVFFLDPHMIPRPLTPCISPFSIDTRMIDSTASEILLSQIFSYVMDEMIVKGHRIC